MNNLHLTSPRTLCVAITLLWGANTWACEQTVRPLGSDHLVYTIERGATDDAPSLTGRKFRLIVQDEQAANLRLEPAEAFDVREISRFEGNVTYNAEITNASALYKKESWGRLPRPLSFHVNCDPSAVIQVSKKAVMTTEEAAEPDTDNKPFVVPSVATTGKPALIPPAPPAAPERKRLQINLAASSDPVADIPLAENNDKVVTKAYQQGTVESAPLPPLPKPEPPVVEEPPPAAATPAPSPVVQSFGTPSNALSPAELSQLEISLQPGRTKSESGGKTRLAYELILRNPLPFSVQCDAEVESFYPKSFVSKEVVSIDRKMHEAIQIRSRGYRGGVTGEIEHFPNVLGGSRWMRQNPANPQMGGLRLLHCVSLRN